MNWALRLMESICKISLTSLFIPILMFLLLCTFSCGIQDSSQAGRPAMPPMEVTVVKLEPRDIPLTLDYLGQTEGSSVVEVRTRVEVVWRAGRSPSVPFRDPIRGAPD